jgi:hypothetical protein
MHPGGIPMTTWPTTMYACDEHRLVVPADLTPGVYLLRAGLYDGETGQRLPALDELGQPDNDVVLLQALRVERVRPLRVETLPARPLVTFGSQIRLLSFSTSTSDARFDLTCYWQATRPITREYAVFVHLLDVKGHLVAQADSPPAGGRYPTIYWPNGEIIEDRHQVSLPAGAVGPFQAAIGLYDPGTMTRLEAVDAQGARLQGDRVEVELK